MQKDSFNKLMNNFEREFCYYDTCYFRIIFLEFVVFIPTFPLIYLVRIANFIWFSIEAILKKTHHICRKVMTRYSLTIQETRGITIPPTLSTYKNDFDNGLWNQKLRKSYWITYVQILSKEFIFKKFFVCFQLKLNKWRISVPKR